MPLTRHGPDILVVGTFGVAFWTRAGAYHGRSGVLANPSTGMKRSARHPGLISGRWRYRIRPLSAA